MTTYHFKFTSGSVQCLDYVQVRECGIAILQRNRAGKHQRHRGNSNATRRETLLLPTIVSHLIDHWYPERKCYYQWYKLS